MTPQLGPTPKPKNIVAFKNGTACVVLFRFAPELTEPEKKRIDAARLLRFFVYACSDAPVPPGDSGIGRLEDYPSLGWAVDLSTYMYPEVLHDPLPWGSPQALINALMDIDTKAGHDDNRGVLVCVVDRPFEGDDCALYRPSASRDACHRKIRPHLSLKPTC